MGLADSIGYKHGYDYKLYLEIGYVRRKTNSHQTSHFIKTYDTISLFIEKFATDT